MCCSALPELMEWAEYTAAFRKQYRSAAAALRREAIFVENVAAIRRHNAEADRGATAHRWGVNQFSDLTQAEFARTVSRPVTAEVRPRRERWLDEAVADEVDWRAKGAVGVLGALGLPRMRVVVKGWGHVM